MGFQRVITDETNVRMEQFPGDKTRTKQKIGAKMEKYGRASLKSPSPLIATITVTQRRHLAPHLKILF